jgi:hypothetical protein
MKYRIVMNKNNKFLIQLKMGIFDSWNIISSEFNLYEEAKSRFKELIKISNEYKIKEIIEEVTL